MSGVEADHVKPPLAQFMHKPWRHWTRFKSNARVIAGVPTHSLLDCHRL
jgi:hypothetical protein